MRIALISYELPPDTGFGGIGTYTHQMAACLIKLGCDVEVFSASLTNAAFNVKTKEGYLVHRIKTSRAENFRDSIAALVAERHHYQPFDIAESPEYRAEGLRVKEMLPHLPMVVKFHTPHFLIRELNQQQKKRLLKYKIKKALGIGIYDKQKDKEYQFSLKCDGMISPSVSLGQIVHERWQIAKEKIAVIPYPFIPSEEFLKISADTQTNYITYLGRLEARKGVHLLAEALPLVFARLPQVRFRFIGRTNVGPYGKGTMLDFLKEKLFVYLNRIDFIDHVEAKEIPQWLAKTDLCVFNSLWENFPNVCLEAMSAAKGIIASPHGGMKDMLEDINGGVLADPYDTEELASALIDMMENPEKRKAMGERSRQKILEYYASEVPKLLVGFYQNVIDTFKEQNKT